MKIAYKLFETTNSEGLQGYPRESIQIEDGEQAAYEAAGYLVSYIYTYEAYRDSMETAFLAWKAEHHPEKSPVKLHRYTEPRLDILSPPIQVDYVTGLKVKLHRKLMIVKGEIQAEEFYASCESGVYSDLIVKETTTFSRDALGFPIYKDVEVKWVCEDGSFHPVTKQWRKYYNSLEKIQEGKVRRGNLFDNLQMPCIGLISYALLGHMNGSPEVILEGRRFLAEYAIEFKTFVDDSNKTILDCLTDEEHLHYVSSADFSWIDAATPYPGVTIRQFIVNELTI